MVVNCFDFIDEKFSGLGDERVKENLTIMKTYWDNKPDFQANIVLDDGTKVEFN